MPLMTHGKEVISLKITALLVLLCAALVFLFAAPAFATPQSECGWDQDQQLEFSLPINLQVNNALWAEFQEATGEQKDSLDIGPVCPDEEASDDGVLVVKSNDDFTKFFNWTSLRWQAEGEDSAEGPFPAILAADLVVTDDGVPLQNGDAVDKSGGIQEEQIVVSYTPDWTHHAGTYKGRFEIFIEQE